MTKTVFVNRSFDHSFRSFVRLIFLSESSMFHVGASGNLGPRLSAQGISTAEHFGIFPRCSGGVRRCSARVRRCTGRFRTIPGRFPRCSDDFPDMFFDIFRN